MRFDARTVALLLLLMVSSTSFAQAENPYLSQAKVFYQGLEYQKCIQRLEQGTRWQPSTHAELAQIEIYFGLCKFNAGKKDEMKNEVIEHFRLALQLDPNIEIPPLTSPRIQDLWKQTVEKYRPAQPEKKPEMKVAGSVPQQALVVEPQPDGPKRNRLPSYIVGGVGLAALAAGVVVGVQASAAAGKERASRNLEEKQSWQRTAYSRGQIADIALIGGAVAVGAAVVLWFIPIGGSSQVAIAPTPTGAFVRGTF